MTPRERITAAINHRESDRVPVDISGTKLTGIHVDEYVELTRSLGMDFGPPKVFDHYQMLARADDLMHRYFGSDVIELENIDETWWGIENKDWKPWTTGAGNSVLVPGGFSPLEDADGTLTIYNKDGKAAASMPKNGFYFDRIAETGFTDDTPLMSTEEWYTKSRPLYTDEHLRLLEKRAKFLHDYTDYAVAGGFNKFTATSSTGYGGQTFTNWLCLLLTEEEYCAEMIDAAARRAVENLKLYLDAVGSYIDIITVSTTDYGTQKAELFSPDIFERIYKPAIKLINDYIHGTSGAKTFYHSCGSIFNIIEHMIEAGVDIINPVQTSADNMDPVKLKNEFGKKVTFWGGGVEAQTTLMFGTPEEVREQVRERISIFAPGGGFVFAPTHNIQCKIPLGNLIAMIEEIKRPGFA